MASLRVGAPEAVVDATSWAVQRAEATRNASFVVQKAESIRQAVMHVVDKGKMRGKDQQFLSAAVSEMEKAAAELPSVEHPEATELENEMLELARDCQEAAQHMIGIVLQYNEKENELAPRSKQEGSNQAGQRKQPKGLKREIEVPLESMFELARFSVGILVWKEKLEEVVCVGR